MERAMFVVAKPFNSTIRRFRVGAELPWNKADDLSPHSFEDLKAKGFIVEKKAEQKAPPSALSKRPVGPRDSD
jgi:hypothetical protein